MMVIVGLEDLPTELREDLHRLSDQQRRDQLDGAVAVHLATRLIAAGAMAELVAGCLG